MRRAERRRAEREGQPPRTLFEIDFLLRVDDEARQGSLRFALTPGGPFLAESGPTRIPPLIELPRLLGAAQRVTGNTDSDDDLRLLLVPGSSLGGARPKASIRDADGQLALAKFPHPADDLNVVRWEGVALTLAARAGLQIPDWRIEAIAGHPVLLVRRFDRAGPRRIPFLSALSLLGAQDREMRSYLEIADALRQYGAAPRLDLAQLWRRLAFNLLISNTDDHLRNHGFLYRGQAGWRLSPAYDLNPVPVDIRPRLLSTTINLDDPTTDLDLALETAAYYDLSVADARQIAKEIASAVSGWRTEALRLGVTAPEIDRMASAFEHEDRTRALHA